MIEEDYGKGIEAGVSVAWYFYTHVLYVCYEIMKCCVVSIFTYNYVISHIVFLLRTGCQFHK